MRRGMELSKLMLRCRQGVLVLRQSRRSRSRCFSGSSAVDGYLCEKSLSQYEKLIYLLRVKNCPNGVKNAELSTSSLKEARKDAVSGGLEKIGPSTLEISLYSRYTLKPHSEEIKSTSTWSLGRLNLIPPNYFEIPKYHTLKSTITALEGSGSAIFEHTHLAKIQLTEVQLTDVPMRKILISSPKRSQISQTLQFTSKPNKLTPYKFRDPFYHQNSPACLDSQRRYASNVPRQNSLTKYRSLQSYLDHTRSKNLSTNSLYFTGTLYELTTLRFLEKYLGVSHLVHSGGSADNGVDLRGKWDLDRFATVDKDYGLLKVPSTGKRLKPLISCSKKQVQLLVQCKLYLTKIGSRTVRELAGSFNFHTRPAEKNRAILMIVAPTNLTAHALLQFNSSDFPLLVLNLSVMKLQDVRLDQFQIDNYKGGKLHGFYMNPHCQLLLKDMDLGKELNKLMV